MKGERIGEATLLVRYQGKFATLPVTVLNPKPGFAWKPLPQNNYIDQNDRRQAAAPEDPAVARGGRCHLPAPRLARSHRPDCRRRTKCARSSPIRAHKPKRAKLIDKLIAQPRVRRSLDPEVGRPAADPAASISATKASTSSASGSATPSRRTSPTTSMVRELLTARGSSYDESRRQLLPRDARPQADHGEDHAGLPRRPHGVRAVPRPSLRALDAESVLRDGGLLLRRRPARRLRSGRRDRFRSASRLRHEASQGRPRGEARSSPGRLPLGEQPLSPHRLPPAATRCAQWITRAETIRSSPRPSPTASGATSSEEASSIRWTTSAPPIRRRIPRCSTR